MKKYAKFLPVNAITVYTKTKIYYKFSFEYLWSPITSEQTDPAFRRLIFYSLAKDNAEFGKACLASYRTIITLSQG